MISRHSGKRGKLGKRSAKFLTAMLAGQLMAMGGSLWAQDKPPMQEKQPNPIRFEDMSEKLGIRQYMKGWELGHGAAWGDVDGDGRPDLYFGTFANRPMWGKTDAPIPNMLFLNKPSGFVLSDEKEMRLVAKRDRTSGALFVDLNNDGKLDLIVGNHYSHEGDEGTLLYQNMGDGHFRNVTPTDPNYGPYQATARRSEDSSSRGPTTRGASTRRSTTRMASTRSSTQPSTRSTSPRRAAAAPPQPLVWPSVVSARNVVAVDLNNDGLLDLVFCDGTYDPSPYNPSWRLIALLNKGNFQFEDVSERLGFTPGDASEQGLAMGDVNEDGIPDFFVCGSNRLFVSSANGTYHEVQHGAFTRPLPTDQRGAMACGATFGDLNGDGRLDLITTVHGQPSRIHIYLNRGVQADGEVRFDQVSKETGVGADFPSHSLDGKNSLIKNTQVAIRDADNDGKMDIFLGITYRDERDQVQPLVLRNLGNDANGVPHFTRPPDDRLVGYYAPAPLCDYDRDGRIDLFMCPWFKEDVTPGYLFRNVTEGGHWLQVRVAGKGPGLNPMGIGSIVRIYEAGRAGDAKALLGRQDMAIGTGYASGDEAIAYFGLGQRTTCDVEVSWGKRKVVQANVKVDQLMGLTVDAAGQAQGK